MRHLGLVVLIGVAVSCARAGAPPAPPQPAVEVAPAEPESAPAAEADTSAGYLAWSYESDQPVSRWYANQDGKWMEAGHVSGVLIATSSAIWQLKTEQQRVTLPSCNEIMESPNFDPTAGEGTLTRAWVEQLGGTSRHELVKPEQPTGASQFDHSVVVIGSVGSMLFLQESAYDYSCGAHGGIAASALTADVDTGKMVDVLTASERARIAGEEGTVARTRFMNAEDGMLDEDASVDLVALSPHWRSGRLVLDGLFATSACYACSDGQWSSYTTTQTIPLTHIPSRFRDLLELPSPLRTRLKDADIRGFSRLTAPQLEQLAQLEP